MAPGEVLNQGVQTLDAGVLAVILLHLHLLPFINILNWYHVYKNYFTLAQSEQNKTKKDIDKQIITTGKGIDLFT